MNKHYFNTTAESAQIELDFERKAVKQEAAILSILQRYNRGFTCFDLLPLLPNNTPVTSIRRALTLLHQAGLIHRIGRRKEMYGRSNYVYGIKAPSPDGEFS